MHSRGCRICYLSVGTSVGTVTSRGWLGGCRLGWGWARRDAAGTSDITLTRQQISWSSPSICIGNNCNGWILDFLVWSSLSGDLQRSNTAPTPYRGGASITDFAADSGPTLGRAFLWHCHVNDSDYNSTLITPNKGRQNEAYHINMVILF